MRSTVRWSILSGFVLVACGDAGGGDAGLDASAADAAPDVDAEADASVAPDAANVCTFEGEDEAPLPEPGRHTARWAFEPWISKDISDRADTLAFVAGFRERDIPVGVVVLDSPWDTNYTNFEPNPTRYPDFTNLVSTLHDDDVRVVLWVTQMTNRTSFDAEIGGDIYRGAARTFREGEACSFFVQNGQLYSWWKGQGAGVDFFHPRARAWWHAQQTYLLEEAGIDGWKLDFGESYLEADQVLETHEGPIPHQQYSEAYYRDFLAYGVQQRGREFVTMVRPWDVSYDRRPRFHARPEHAPVAWVGDNHRDWTGIVDALDHILRSVDAGYVVVGSDIGGYLDRDQNNLSREIAFDLEVFQRWTALGAMTPFMQLHSRGNLAPWTVPGTPAEQAETVELYRYWATLHHAMVPFWYSLTEDAYARSTGTMRHSIMQSTTPESAWATDPSYTIGNEIGSTFFVAPVVAPGNMRRLTLPSGHAWYDWWAPAAAPHAGGTTLDVDVTDRAHIPLYVREGSIIPMHVENDVNGLGRAESANRLTLLVWPNGDSTVFTLREGESDAITVIAASRGATSTEVSLTPAHGGLVLRIQADAAPATVRADARAITAAADEAAFWAAAESYRYDATNHAVWIRVDAAAELITLE